MKNKFLTIASAVVVLCLITTCAFSTTLAKYVTGDSASDTARVAKWGIEVSTSGTLFGDSYSDVANGNTITYYNHANASVVADTDGVAIVAPGTQNDTGFQVKITGTPEVDYAVSAATDGTIEDIYLAAGSYGMMVEQYGVNESTDLSGLYMENAGVYTPATTYYESAKYYKLQDAVTLAGDYYPVVWSVAADGGLAGVTLSDAKDLNAIAADLIAAVDALDGQANEASDASLRLTWAWAFEQDNGADTILGNLIAGKANIVVADGTSYNAITVTDNVATANGATVANLDVTFQFSVTVEQVD